jgi:LacI family transcriptional regulator
VSDAVRERVNIAIEGLSFTPNVIARSFKTGKRNTIGFIVPDISNIFFATVIEETENVLSKKGYRLIVTNTKETPMRELNHIRTLANGLVDGLIIASTLESYEEIADILPRDFPQLFLDRAVKNCPTDQVLLSSETAIRQGVADLIEKGHTRIGYIAGLRRLSTTTERLNAFIRELKEHNLEPDETLIYYTNSMAQSARSCTQKLLEANCTAIVVSNDIMTMDAVNYVQQYSANTSKTCQILGYSYGGWYSWLPNLKTIMLPAREIGGAVGQQILQRIEKPDAPIREILLSSLYAGA